jgi:hypothetical protein
MSSLAAPNEQQTTNIALADLLDRLLGAGVVLSGDITISLAGVDLIQVRLHALISSIRAGDLTGGEHESS